MYRPLNTRLMNINLAVVLPFMFRISDISTQAVLHYRRNGFITTAQCACMSNMQYSTHNEPHDITDQLA